MDERDTRTHAHAIPVPVVIVRVDASCDAVCRPEESA